MASVGIFGAGWVGLVTGVCLADLGHDVVVRDIVTTKVAALRRGEVPFHEAGLDELLARNADRLTFTDRAEDLAGCDFLFVCVDTPPTQSGDADLSRVWTVVDELPETDGHAVLVMKSTVPVGTGEKVRHGLDERGLGDVGYASNPEFLAEGTAVRDFMHPDRIVVGGYDQRDIDAVADLYAGLEANVVRCDVKSAEMIKLAANAFLMTRISFINEIANVCDVTGADVVKVAEGIGLDRRLGPHFLRAGIGYGGSCLVGSETVLARLGDRTWLTSLEALYDELAEQAPQPLEVLSWSEEGGPTFMPVAAVTRRDVEGELVDVRTSTGHRISTTPDHPFVTASGVKLAGDLSDRDWLPLAIGAIDRPAAGTPRRLRDRVRTAGAPAGGRLAVEPPSLASSLGSEGVASLDAGHLPEAIWSAPEPETRAALASLWSDAGSWSFVGAGIGVTFEYATASRSVADGVLRLLATFEIVGRLKVARTARVATVSYRVVVSGASGVRRLLELVDPPERAGIDAALIEGPAALSSPDLRTRAGSTWVRVTTTTRRSFAGPVYSVEVPGPHTFVTTGGLVVHNCFPKDSLALKQLASNSGYHFMLLAAVIEVNDLQKRRVVGKLRAHLGTLRGKKIALLGLAFKPGTDDMREAPSIILAARLIAEGAEVRGWDPVADGSALTGVKQVSSVAEAVADADAAVIVTEWPELAGLASPEVRESMANPLIIDGRNLLDPETVRAAGFQYEGIGRPAPAAETVESV